MTKKDLNNWIMYYEIHKLKRLGFSISKIGRHLVIDERTVNKYLQMSEQDYEHFLIFYTERKKILSPYENFVKEKLGNSRILPLHKFMTGSWSTIKICLM